MQGWGKGRERWNGQDRGKVGDPAQEGLAVLAHVALCAGGGPR